MAHLLGLILLAWGIRGIVDGLRDRAEARDTLAQLERTGLNGILRLDTTND